MREYIIRRLLLAIPTFFGITIVTFTVLHLAPGGPIEAQVTKMRLQRMSGDTSNIGVNASQNDDAASREKFEAEAIALLKELYGYDKPLLQRYFIWIGFWPREIEKRKIHIGEKVRYITQYIYYNGRKYALQRWIYIDKDEKGNFAVFQSGIAPDIAYGKYRALPPYELIKKWTKSDEKWHIDLDKTHLEKTGDTRYSLYKLKLKGIFEGYFGDSFAYRRPVLDVFASKMHISIYFGFISFVLGYVVTILLGISKALRHKSFFDTSSSVILLVLYSVPAFVVALFLLLVFSVWWPVLPLGDFRPRNWDQLNFLQKIFQQFRYTLLPLISWNITGYAGGIIYLKNLFLEELGKDYVRTAFAKGLTEKRVIYVHVFRNAFYPMIGGIFSIFFIIFTGSMLIEKTFNIQGLGYIALKAVEQRDYPYSLGMLVISTTMGLITQVLGDISLAIIDPRVRFD